MGAPFFVGAPGDRPEDDGVVTRDPVWAAPFLLFDFEMGSAPSGLYTEARLAIVSRFWPSRANWSKWVEDGA